MITNYELIAFVFSCIKFLLTTALDLILASIIRALQPLFKTNKQKNVATHT